MKKTYFFTDDLGGGLEITPDSITPYSAGFNLESGIVEIGVKLIEGKTIKRIGLWTKRVVSDRSDEAIIVLMNELLIPYLK